MRTEVKATIMTCITPSAEPKAPLNKLPSVPAYDGKNPFVDGCSTLPDWIEKLKIVLFTVTLIAPLRVLLLILIPFVSLLYIMIVTAGHCSSEPISATSVRGRLLQLLRYPCYVLLAVGGFYRINVVKHKGCDLRSNKTRVYVSNHVSVWDGFFYFALTGCCFLIRDDIFKIPIFGHAIKYGVQCVGIDRSSESGRKNAVQIIRNYVANENAPPLLIFPSGTTCNQRILTKFKAGAFMTGVAVQPLILKYNNTYSNLGYSADYDMFTVMYYSLCQVINHIDIIALPVYEPTKQEIENPDLFADNVRNEMAKYLQATKTNHVDTDCALYEFMRDHCIKAKTKFVISEFTHKFGLHHTSFLKLAKAFKQWNTSRSGMLNVCEFAQLFGVEYDAKCDDGDHDVIATVFKMATDDETTMGLDEFLVLISTMLSAKNTCKMAMISLWFRCLVDSNSKKDGIIRQRSIYDLYAKYKASPLCVESEKVQQYYTRFNDILFGEQDDKSKQAVMKFDEFQRKLANNYQVVHDINCHILKHVVKLPQFEKIKARVK